MGTRGALENRVILGSCVTENLWIFQPLVLHLAKPTASV